MIQMLNFCWPLGSQTIPKYTQIATKGADKHYQTYLVEAHENNGDPHAVFVFTVHCV